MAQRSLGVLVGRFQVPQLHDGHLAIINHVAGSCDETCILVGRCKTPNLKNPLPYAAVAAMIRKDYEFAYGQGRLHIHGLSDIPGNDLAWSHRLDSMLNILFPDYSIRLYSGRDSFKASYHGRHRPVIDWYGYDGNVNGTRSREEIYSMAPLNSAEFRKGIIYGVGKFFAQQDQEEGA